MDRTLVVLILFSVIGYSETFLSNDLGRCLPELTTEDGRSGRSNSQPDHTHKSITSQAIQATLNNIGADQGDVTGSLWQLNIERRRALEAILAASADIDRLEHNLAASHFNGEQLLQANKKIQDWTTEIVKVADSESASKRDVIRRLIGRSLHLIQDFYSNTDWIEINSNGGTKFFKNLGVRNASFLTVDTAQEFLTCLGQTNNDPNGNRHNIFHVNTWISSGYRSGQDAIKPPVKNQSWLSGTVIGKCSHGGHYDASSLEGPTGGMNKETRSFLLSPHFYLHDSAASSAADASQHYLNSDVGLSSFLSPLLLNEVLGANVPQHICFLATAELVRLATAKYDTQLWEEMLLQKIVRWPYDINHLVTAVGHSSSMSASELYGSKELLALTPVAPTQQNIIRAAMTVPEYSTLVVVTALPHPIEGSWDEEILRKALAQRNIRLLVFISYNQHEELDEIPLLHYNTQDGGVERFRLCPACRLYTIETIADLISLMQKVPTQAEITEFGMDSTGHVKIPLMPRQEMFVEINCVRPQRAAQTSITAVNGEVRTRLEFLSPTVFLYRLLSEEKSPLLLEASLPDHSCSVSAYTAEKLVHVYPIQPGPWGQMFTSTIRAQNDSGLLVASDSEFAKYVSPSSVVIGNQITNLTSCRLGEGNYSITTSKLLDSVQPDFLSVNYQFMDTQITIEEFVGVKRIDFRGDSTTTGNLTVTLTNGGRSAWYHIKIIASPEVRVSVTPSEFELDRDETMTLNVEVENAQYNTVTRGNAILLLTGDDSQMEYHDVHTFSYALSAQPEPSTTTISKTTTTPPTSTTTPTTTTVANRTKSSIRTIVSTRSTIPNEPVTTTPSITTHRTAQPHSSTSHTIWYTEFTSPAAIDRTTTPTKPFHRTTIGAIITSRIFSTFEDKRSTQLFIFSLVGTILTLVTPMVVIVTVLVVARYCHLSFKSKHHIPVTSL